MVEIDTGVELTKDSQSSRDTDDCPYRQQKHNRTRLQWCELSEVIRSLKTRAPAIVRITLVWVLILGTVGPALVSAPAQGVKGTQVSVSPATPASEATVTATMTVETGDSIANESISEFSIDLDRGSFAQVDPGDLYVAVGSQDNANGTNRVAQAVNLSTDADDRRLVATLNRSLSAAAGDRVTVQISDVGTPEREGAYGARFTVRTEAGVTGGPFTTTYRIQSAHISIPEQRAEKITDRRQGNETANGNETVSRTVRVSALMPNGGYISVFTDENGNPGALVGVMRVQPSLSNRTYEVGVDISTNQALIAIPYYETGERGLNQERSEGFSQIADEPYVRSNEVISDRGAIVLRQPTAQVRSGGEYVSGAQLLFTQAEPNTQYEIRVVDDGRARDEVVDFQTNRTGVAVINSANFSTGKYAIMEVTGNDVVNLDGDSVTSAADDGFIITDPINSTASGGTENTTTVVAPSEDGGLNPMFLFLFVIFAFMIGGGAAAVYRRQRSY